MTTDITMIHEGYFKPRMGYVLDGHRGFMVRFYVIDQSASYPYFETVYEMVQEIYCMNGLILKSTTRVMDYMKVACWWQERQSKHKGLEVVDEELERMLKKWELLKL